MNEENERTRRLTEIYESAPKFRVDLSREATLAIVDLIFHPYYRADLLLRVPGDVCTKLEKAKESLDSNASIERIPIELSEFDVATIGSAVIGELARDLPPRTVQNEFGYPELDKETHAYAFLDLFEAYKKAGGIYDENNQTREFIERMLIVRDKSKDLQRE